jgi:hypothetical protein
LQLVEKCLADQAAGLVGEGKMERHDVSTPRQRIEIGRTRIAIIRDDPRG